MAGMVPGGGSRDNVMGDQYTLDIGVEPDLGGLIANLETANDLLDDADAKFGAIADTVATTTQRVNQLTRATQQFVAETARIRSEYQQIASIPSPDQMISTSGYNVSAPAVGPAMGGGGYGIPMGPMAPGGYGTIDMGAMQAAANVGAPAPQRLGGGWQQVSMGANQAREMLRAFGQGNDYGVLNKPETIRNRFEALYRLTRGQQLRGGELGWAARALNSNPALLPNISSALENLPAFDENEFNNLAALRQGLTLGDLGMSRAIQEAQTLGGPYQNVLTNAIRGQGGAGIGMLASLAGRAMPVIGAGMVAYGAATQINQRVADLFRGAKEYGAVTGGTSIAQSIGMKLENIGRSGEFLGFDFNPLISSEEAKDMQMNALAAGYDRYGKQSGRYAESMRYMDAITRTGMMGVGDQFDLYQQAAASGGAGIGVLTNSLLSLRTLAKDTGKSLQIMTAAFKENVGQYMAMGMTGTGSLAASQMVANMFSGAYNPNTRNFTGYDMSSSIWMQGSVARQAGVSWAQLPSAMSMPGMGVAVPAMQQDAVRKMLLQVSGLRPDSSGFVSRDAILGADGGTFIRKLQMLAPFLGIPPEQVNTTENAISFTQQAIGTTGAEMATAAMKNNTQSITGRWWGRNELDPNDPNSWKHSRFYSPGLLGGPALNAQSIGNMGNLPFKLSTEEDKKRYTYMMEEMKHAGIDLSNEALPMEKFGWKYEQGNEKNNFTARWVKGSESVAIGGEGVNLDEVMNDSALGGLMKWQMETGRYSSAAQSAIAANEQGRTLVKYNGKVYRLGDILRTMTSGNKSEADAARKIFNAYSGGGAETMTLSADAAQSAMQAAQSGTGVAGMTTYDASNKSLQQGGMAWTSTLEANIAAGTMSESGSTYTKYGAADGITFSPQALIGIETAVGRAITHAKPMKDSTY